MTPLDITRFVLEGHGIEGEVCAKCGSRSLGLCAALDAEGLHDMAGETERFTLEAREPLFRQGDPAKHVFTVTSGTARLVRVLADGRQAAIGFRFGGDILGYTVGEEYAFGAEALTPVSVCRMERKRLEAMLKRYPVLERRFRELAAQELADSQDHILALGRFTAEERVAAFLMTLIEAQERRGHAGPVFDLPATRADIGEFLGLTLETVSRAISAFRKRGWLKLHGHSGIELLDRTRLRLLASGESDGEG